MSLLKHCADGNLIETKAILRHSKGRRNKLEARDNHNWTCLHHAVKSGNAECVKYLLTISELDTTAETFEGETALHIACSMPNASIEIISTLIEANPDLINFVNNEEVDLLKCAIMRDRLDIVQLLVASGSPVNKQDLDGDTLLHIAAIGTQLDAIRYLLYDTQCDATIRNENGKTACTILFAKLLEKLIQNATVSPDEIDCFEELTQFTYDSLDINNPTDNELDLNQMIYVGYLYDRPRNCLYARIMKSFYVPPTKQYFFERILQSNVASCHCLIIALLAHLNADNSEHTFELWSKFLLELFTLFLSDEAFFLEYIAEVMSSGWICSLRCQVSKFCSYLKKQRDTLELQQLFTFLKVLILYAIDFDILMRCCEMVLMPTVMLTVFAPLAKFVMPTYPLGRDCFKCNYNFNESDVLGDISRSMDHNLRYEVVSLKNICRMSIRRYYFQTYPHYAAIKTLYSVNIPLQIRNFLCYNVCNFQF